MKVTSVILIGAGIALLWWSLTELKVIGPLSRGYKSPTAPAP